MREKIKKGIKALSDAERELLLLELLQDDVIDYTSLSFAYVRLLKRRNRQLMIRMAGIADPLSQYIDGLKPKTKHGKFTRAKAEYNLYKSGIFDGTVYGDELAVRVKESGYAEDENGMPI